MQKVSPGAELELKAVADRAGWLPCHIQLGKWVSTSSTRGHTAGHTSLVFHQLSNLPAGHLVSEKDDPLHRSHCAVTQWVSLLPSQTGPFLPETGVGLRRNRAVQGGLQPAVGPPAPTCVPP